MMKKICIKEMCFKAGWKNAGVALAMICSLIFCQGTVQAQSSKSGAVSVGVARMDITPYGPIRLSGYLRYDARINESEGVLQQLWAKAIAFGNDAQNPSILITVDLAGIQSHMVRAIGNNIAKKRKFNPDNLVICASHTHSGPDMGNSHNMYFEPLLPADQLARIALYLDSLAIKLEQVALQALDNRQPSLLSWGQGTVGFALNRRVITNGKWTGHGKVPDGPVDHTLPLLRITDTNGKLKAIFVSYACHGTTLFADINKTHGDWIGEAQRIMEERHPGIIAMVAQGCGGDSDPNLRGKLEHATQHGTSIANEADRLLSTPLKPLTAPPSVKVKTVQLPFDHVPGTKEFIEMIKAGEAQGHNAEVHLERIVRGIPIDSTMNYPIECWTFGNQMAMVFLAGEVVADYSLRLRKELGTERLWINAYTNDVKAYIPSKRIIPQGGYEVEGNMYYYDHPFRFSERIEDIIIKGVYDVLPAWYKPRARKK
ncbi:MAG: neutral/alkaline non-lysosomal ceramidase N-terminal domain-containing protein [Agriterribacter sp.]